MRVYTRETLRNPRRCYALILAKKFRDDLIDFADLNPEAREYRNSIIVDTEVAYIIFEFLKEMFPDSLLLMTFEDNLDENGEISQQPLAKYHIDWS